MLIDVPWKTQSAQARDDELRVLVVGAGIAGITVAQLLRRQGLHPVLVERHRDEGHPGYMVALMPIVDAALDELGVRDDYRARSAPLGRYRVLSHRGRPIRTDSMADVLDVYGDYQGISRSELIRALSGDGCDVAFGTTVSALCEQDGVVTATLDGGDATASAEFDLVIAADGIRSATRSLVLGDGPLDEVDTEWGGWIVWADLDDDPDLGSEVWGDGFFIGSYPVKDALGIFVGGRNDQLEAGPVAYDERVRRALRTVTDRTDRALRTLLAEPDPYYWSLTDVRAPTWSVGRTVLLGDAAAGFLPTAGIGAAMAIESAWMLAGALRGATVPDVAARVARYETVQRPRVEAAQDNSRQLARLMFRGGGLVATARDVAVRLMSIESAIGPIRRLLADQPDPARLPA